MRINLYEILFWIFFVLSVIVILWYIFGDSPTLEQALLILIITFLFKIQSSVITNNYEIKTLKSRFKNLENSFIKYASYEWRDFITHKPYVITRFFGIQIRHFSKLNKIDRKT